MTPSAAVKIIEGKIKFKASHLNEDNISAVIVLYQMLTSIGRKAEKKVKMFSNSKF